MTLSQLFPIQGIEISTAIVSLFEREKRVLPLRGKPQPVL